ncbi:MAG: class I lanthipeptide [Bacteroidetes bacterium]|nr:class I lanthipeptide [Bacteroidota bacterium]
MKKTINKLSLNKSTISNLSHSALDQINGGAKTAKCIPNLTNPCGTLACSAGCPTGIGCPSMMCTIKK